MRELLAYGSAAAAEETRGLWPDGVPPSEYAHSRDDIRSVELLEAAESREVAKFVGRRVELSGLKEKPQLNRRRGTVRHFVWDGRLDTGRESPPSQVPRFAVSIDGEAADDLHPLQKQNLVLLADAEQVDAAAPAGGHNWWAEATAGAAAAEEQERVPLLAAAAADEAAAGDEAAAAVGW